MGAKYEYSLSKCHYPNHVLPINDCLSQVTIVYNVLIVTGFDRYLLPSGFAGAGRETTATRKFEPLGKFTVFARSKQMSDSDCIPIGKAQNFPS